jgi:hypothetical protein
MRKDVKRNEEKAKILFASQTEAKIMQNRLRFVSISHGSEKKFK